LAASRPNILLIITHDTGRHLGCYGRPVDTPNFDRLAREGVQFEEAYCTAPQCSPSRASLITGLTPHQHGLVGLVNRGFQLSQGIPRLPALLAATGYTTHLFGIQHEARLAEQLGYQFVHEADSRSCREVTPLVVDFLRSAGQAPFFASVGFFETHRKYPESPGPWDEVEVPEFLPNAPEIRRDVADLNLSVGFVDEAVGVILDTLDQSGLADQTLLIYTTDHGIAFPGAKGTLFDPGIQIALLARGPGGFRGGKRIATLVRNLDLFPTLLEVAGTISPTNEGRSLIPLVHGESTGGPERIFSELNYHVAYDPVRCVRTRRYKYIRSFEPRSWWVPSNVDGGPRMQGYTKAWYRANQPDVFTRPRPAELLFDLTTDPLERHDVANDPAYRDTLNELRRELLDWQVATNDPLLSGVVPPQPGVQVAPPDQWDP
jgi:N-sulfoglucosamine sulfohydrolase